MPATCRAALFFLGDLKNKKKEEKKGKRGDLKSGALFKRQTKGENSLEFYLARTGISLGNFTAELFHAWLKVARSSTVSESIHE